MNARFLKAAIMSVLPCNSVRVALLRRLLGYDIDAQAHIGPLTVIDADVVHIGRSRIRGICLFRGPLKLTIGNGASIGS